MTRTDNKPFSFRKFSEGAPYFPLKKLDQIRTTAPPSSCCCLCLPALVLASVLRRRDVSVQLVNIDEDAAGFTSFLLRGDVVDVESPPHPLLHTIFERAENFAFDRREFVELLLC